ncbi:MAG: type I methionyl aminopeptidase [Fibrobacteraceae bacterium]|nr:type I methionyl aminopeptidase [Fibrobacteraceae bacterium]
MAHIKVKTQKEIELIRSAGALAAETLIRAGEMCKPGVSTLEIDEFIGNFTKKNGGISACMGYHGYPRYACISLNEVICHGIPDAQTILKDGDILNIDITTILSGYHGDTSAMFLVGNVKPEVKELVATAKLCMEEGIKAAGLPGARFSDIGNAIQPIADEHGFSVVEDYCGHGIGRGFHEEPTVLHFANNEHTPLIEVGNVFTIEPMINMGKPGTRTLKDGWTAVSCDGSLSAQWEHTMVRTKSGIDILTLPR